MTEDSNDDFFSHRELPIYKKAMEIFDLASKLADLIDEEDEMLKHYKEFMLQDASMISAKIAGAEGADIYDIRMECAAIVRKCARDLATHCTGLEIHDFKDTQYLPLVRDAIEEFRLLFIDWVAGFDQWNYIIDRWGLFNPPGIGPFDHDPDDDLPFLRPNDDGDDEE